MNYPYTLREVKLVIDKHQMDRYHKELIKWLVSRIEELEKEIKLSLGE